MAEPITTEISEAKAAAPVAAPATGKRKKSKGESRLSHLGRVLGNAGLGGVAAGGASALISKGLEKTIGKTVFFTLKVTITTNGTGATNIRVTLPTAALVDQAIYGRDFFNGGMLQGNLSAGSAVFTMLSNTGGYPGTDSAQLVYNGVYETQ